MLAWSVFQFFLVFSSAYYEDVKRHTNGTLYMAFYFPQYHFVPENIVNGRLYTDWDFIDVPFKSISPLLKYSLSDASVYDAQDDMASKFNIGVFIFYHYWLNHSMVMNLPIDLFMAKKRKTKFMLCWDNEGGNLGAMLYDKPEQHAYQLLRYFLNENYLTDDQGRKPFLVYIVPGLQWTYVQRFETFVALSGVKLKIGYAFHSYLNHFRIPEWSSFAVEFAIHTNGANGEYQVRSTNFDDYWQSALVSWDNRPRIASGRSRQSKDTPLDKPTGVVDPHVFKLQLDIINNHIAANNRDRVVTLFAWNEWTEGAALECSYEFGCQFAQCLQ